MKVQGDDILSGTTEKTSRNLKATAALVIAVKLFDVPVQRLQVLNVTFPTNLFDFVSFAVTIYMITILVLYWRVDYLLWRDGSMMAAMNAIEERLRSIKDIITDIEQFLKREVVENVQFIEDQLGSMKVSVLEYRRSLAKTTWWVRFIIIGFHLAIPLTLGVFALWLVAQGAWAALSNLAG